MPSSPLEPSAGRPSGRRASREAQISSPLPVQCSKKPPAPNGPLWARASRWVKSGLVV